MREHEHDWKPYAHTDTGKFEWCALCLTVRMVGGMPFIPDP